MSHASYNRIKTRPPYLQRLACLVQYWHLVQEISLFDLSKQYRVKNLMLDGITTSYWQKLEIKAAVIFPMNRLLHHITSTHSWGTLYKGRPCLRRALSDEQNLLLIEIHPKTGNFIQDERLSWKGIILLTELFLYRKDGSLKIESSPIWSILVSELAMWRLFKGGRGPWDILLSIGVW